MINIDSEPEELKRRMQSKDFMEAAIGGCRRTDSSVQSLFIMDDVQETESEEEEDELVVDDEDEVNSRLETLRRNSNKNTCLGNHWRDRDDFYSSSSESSDDNTRDPLKNRIKKQKEEKKANLEEKKAPVQKAGVLSSAKKERSKKSIGDQLKEISQKIKKPLGASTET